MLGAEVFVLELRHLALRGVDGLTQVSPQIWRCAPMDACATGELGFKLFFKLRWLDPESFE